MRRLESLLAVAVLSALVLGISACGNGSNGDSGSSGGSGATVTQTKTVNEPAPDSSAAPSSSGGASGDSWTMPDLTGKDLQTAQDAIQSLTSDAIYFTHPHDATGQGRHQILDRDWQVCSSDPAPGAKITTGSNIDFAVVRVDTEHCP